MKNREIDALIARHFMGWYWDGEAFCSPDGTMIRRHSVSRSESLPHYSSRIEAAWEVLEKFNVVNLDRRKTTYEPDKTWRCVVMYQGDNSIAEADTAPLAICLAALKSKGVEVNV